MPRLLRRIAQALSVLTALSLFAACGDAPAKPAAGAAAPALDHTSPKALVESFFAIAASGDLSALAGLAAPAGADGDSKEIAGSGTGTPEQQARVRKAFGPGRIDGEIEVKGDGARVKILFGPGAKDKETLDLVKIGEKWYLRSL